MCRKKIECSWRYIQDVYANNDVVYTKYSSSNSEEEKASSNINNYSK